MSLEKGIDIRDGFYVPETVSSLAVSDSGDLVVGGRFETVSGTVGNGLIRWDGESWSSLEGIVEGVNGPVETLVTDGRKLYVGGSFTRAGGKVSANLARYFLDGVPPMEVFGSRATAFFRAIPAGGYRVDRTTDFITWENLATRYATESGGIDFTDGAAPEERAFYRAVPVEP